MIKFPLYGSISILMSILISIPFWFFWTVCSIGSMYFYWLPKVYQSISFFDCLALFICVSILKNLLIPHFSSCSQIINNSKKEGKTNE